MDVPSKKKLTLPKYPDHAFTGLEAAIVLIAFVVVAAVFAYVVLGAGFLTTQKSQEVVHAGIASASSTIQLAGDVYGISTNGVTMDMFNFSISLAAGGTPLDFDKVAITYSNKSVLETLQPVSGLRSSSTTPGGWSIIDVSGEQGVSNNVLEKGEQFIISAHPTVGTPKDTEVTIELKPGEGSAISIHRTIPASVKTVNPLY
ncbi:MAG: flagellin [Methanoregula sp.]